MSQPDVCITEFTDPGCPWAYSAEPFRRRIDWLYGDSVGWSVRMVVIGESRQEVEKKGFTPEKQAAALDRIAHEHGMPISTAERPRMAATLPACRAVIAARIHAPERMRPLLRALRVRNFSGQLLDEPDTVAGAAREAGLDPDELDGWAQGADVERELREDMADARQPMPAAHALDHKLGNWSGGRRYTCPSYEIVRQSDGVRIAVPGFQPFAAYDVVLANLVPASERREPPESAAQVLRWAEAPLASKEVAVLLDTDMGHAREQLGSIATETHVGFDGFWSLKA